MPQNPSRKVLITGGVRRLGLAIAEEFARRGASLALGYHTAPRDVAEAAAEGCRSLGAESVVLIEGDITERAEEILAGATAELSGIDVLVNNAGVMPERRALAELTRAQFLATLELNLLAPFELSRAAAGIMPDASRIINLASLGGVQIWKSRIDYNVSKSALITLTEALARELAPRQITVNAVAPGAIAVDADDEQKMGIAREKIPMGHYGTATDIANAVLYFAYDGAYVTGQTLIVDGGRHLI